MNSVCTGCGGTGTSLGGNERRRWFGAGPWPLVLPVIILWTLVLGITTAFFVNVWVRHWERESLDYVRLMAANALSIASSDAGAPEAAPADVAARSRAASATGSPAAEAMRRISACVHGGRISLTRGGTASGGAYAESLRVLEESGAREWTDVVRTEEGLVRRLVVQLGEDAECLRCHRDADDGTGAVRAGMVVDLPLYPFRQEQDEDRTLVFIGFLIVWLLGASFAAASATLLHRRSEEIRASEDRYRRLFDRGPHPSLVFRVGPDGSFGPLLQINDAACSLLGCERSSVLGRPTSELFEDIGPELEKAVTASVEKRERVSFETTLTTETGAAVPVDAEFASFEERGGPAVLVLAVDLGDVRTAERALRRRTRQLTVLSSATRRLNEDLDMRTIVEHLVAAAMEAASTSGAIAGLVEGEEIVFSVYAGRAPEGDFALSPRLRRGEGVAGHVWETMAPHISNDVPNDRFAPASLRKAVTSLVAVPIIDRSGEFIGCLEVFNRADGRPLDDEDALILTGLAASAAIAIDNTRGVDALLHARSQLLADQKRLRSLASELSTSSERERRAIAAELHDQIGQSLAIARMKLGQAAAEAELVPAVSEARALLEQAIADTRSLTFQLSPPLLYELGLGAAIEWLAEETEKQQGVTTTCETCDLPGDVPDDLRALLYVCTRELILNAVKHAGGSRIEVALRYDGHQIRIAVRDDGAGFDAESVRRSSPTFGLFSVNERLGGFGGGLEVRSSPGQGTTALIAVPFEHDSES